MISQAGTVWTLALTYEEFDVDWDQTSVDQQSRIVEIHLPDGKPDILQQVEHGVLSILGGYHNLGRLYRGIICNDLRQYVLLGDGEAMSDGLKYNPELDEKIFDNSLLLNALNFVLGNHPGENTSSFASGVGSKSLLVAYGTDRANWSFFPGGVASGTGIIRPDYTFLSLCLFPLVRFLINYGQPLFNFGSTSAQLRIKFGSTSRFCDFNATLMRL